MADGQLTQLAQALKAASQPVALSAEFMSGAGVTPPAGLDAGLAAAFRLPATPPGVAVTYDASNVGPVTDGQLEVTSAQLSFLGYDPSNSDVTLRFTQGAEAVEVLIAVALEGWSWPLVFCAMTGWPFDELSYATPGFVFSSAQTTYSWNGQSVAVAAGQNFVGTASVPDAFAPIFALVSGLGSVPSQLTIAGPVVLDRANVVKSDGDCKGPQSEPVILYPDLDLRATIATKPVGIFFLTLREPAIGLLVETAKEVIEPSEDADPDAAVVAAPETVYEQTPSLYFAAKLDVGQQVTYDLRARLLPSSRTFGFSLIVDPDSTKWLSPATAIELLAGASGESFLASVPAPLQQFLASIGLEGLGLSGVLQPSVALTSASVSLASAPNTHLVLFGDPTSGQDFAIDGFRVDWRILNPGDANASLTLVTISAEFELWPAVFKGKFGVSIDQDMRIAGRFDGSVSLGDLLSAVTKGAVTLPSGVQATFSAVDLYVDPTARSYSFGATLDATLDFLTVAGKPLLAIQGMRFTLAALTPSGATGTTVYRGQIAGALAVGPLATNVDILYDGTATPAVWKLSAALAQPLALSDLLNQFFRAYGLPSFLPGSITINAFSIKATIPSGPTAASYAIDGKLTWDQLPFGGSIQAQIGIVYDGTRPAGQQYSGSVIGTVHLDTPALTVEVGYRFAPASADPPALPAATGDITVLPVAPPALAAATGDSTVLWVAWQGIRGEYDFGTKKVTISLAGWSVGSLITALVRTLGDPYFTLPSPWDLLNKLSLDGLKLVIDTSANATQRLSAEYTLSSPIELGFFTINGLVFNRGADGKVTLAIDGSTTIPGLGDQPLFKPSEGGQDVQQMPSVPGKGNAYFELWLLMLGQRVAIRDAPSFDSTQAVITALQKVPSSATTTNPVDPSNPASLQPYYDPSAGWLVAAHFGVLQVAGEYTFECMVVFNDPNLYGLRLAFKGDKAKVLAGLSIDVLYKKVSEDVGVYQIEFTFPAILRNLDFGAFTVTLPTIGIQIYTNGDFLFDFGFPYNLDFSRSFTLQAVILGVPVLGSAGFYFGKLPPAAVPQIPQNATGTFSDAIVVGLGAQLGVGRYFEAGPLKAGFSITVFGIVEGAIASWTPPAGSQLPATTSGSAVQGDYWFWLHGTFGLIGKLYGSVDFGIIKADVQLTVQLVAQITYEAFANIELSASASVSVSVTIKIDLGIFSIRISFSFQTTITANLTIETHGKAPWYPNQVAAAQVRRPLAAADMPAPNFKYVVVTSGPPKLRLTPAPQYTVLGPQGAQQGAFVFLLAMDAPAATGPERGDTSFEALANALVPWVLDAYINQSGTQVNLDTFATTTSVSKGQLEDIVNHLSGSPISESDVESKLLAKGFTVNLAQATAADKDALQAGATVFPPFTGLSLTFPDPAGGQGQKTIALADYVTVDSGYSGALATLFQKLAARVEAESGGSSDTTEAVGGAAEPLSQFVFEDWFAIVASQLLQAAVDSITDYAYALKPGDSIGSIVGWAHTAGNPKVDAVAVAEPNLTHGLSPNKPLYVTGLTYTVQKSDTLSSIAASYSDPAATPRWTTSPAALVEQNAGVHGLVAAGVTVTYPGVNPYVTRAGDSFADVASGLGGIPIATLAAQPSLQTQAGLLSPSVQIAIPDIAYMTATDGSDTLQGVVQRFATPLATLVGDTRNQQVTDLFAAGTIAIAGLDSLLVSDLWQALLLSDKVAQVAGMVARFALHGMRLPDLPGLTLPGNFFYPTGQPDYGLYQLTGQQFPTPTLSDAPSYGIKVAKDSSLPWLEFAGNVGTESVSLELSEQARQLWYLLRYAQSQGFDPQATLSVQPEATTAAKRFALQAPVLWSSSDQATLAALAAPPASTADSGPAAQPQPMLWDLPRSLLQRVEAVQAALERRFDKTSELLEYLPVVEPQLVTTDPASGHATPAPVDDRVFVTRVPFQIKRLPQTDDLAPQRPDANDIVPPGPGNQGGPAPLAPYNYELIGPNPADALLLERLLTAMDSLGQGLISQLFLLYQPGGAAASGLTSRGDSEFLAFITQTNLSTETNPPTTALAAALDAGPPRGIANSPAEFVKLLWELSTVRSGGYYLYFQVPAEGAGLPDTLFDSSGVATLTLVIAYARSVLDAAGGGRVTSFVNAFATTGAIDVGRSAMTVESMSAPAAAAPLAGTESLADLSALYGTDVGMLASLNETATLSTGSQIPISAVVHQVDAQDLAGGNAWAAVATYYSVGAATPVTAADLQAYNPGVTPALGAALRIPPLTYVVGNTVGGPGATFAGLAGYYGLTYDALGAAAAAVPGLFAASSTPTVDSEERDVVHGLGTGNAGIEVTRANLGDPPDLPQDPSQAQQDAFGQAYLFSLYTMLQSSILAGPSFFDASPWGMPFGPVKPLDAAEAAAHRDPEVRRAALLAAADEPLQYALTIGLHSDYTLLNPAPDPAEGLPAKKANPYAGVGSVLGLDLRWVDVFGNLIATPADPPPPDPIDYADRLIGLGQWPNVRTYHTYSGTAGQPELSVTFELQTGVYDAPSQVTDGRNRVAATGVPVWQQTAINDLKTYTQIYFQLNQNYDLLKPAVPGLSGQAVSMALQNSLLAEPVVALSDQQEQTVRDFVAACLLYVGKRANGESAGAAPQAIVTMPVATTAVASEDIIPLRLEFTLARQPGLVDPSLRPIGGTTDSTPIHPATSADLATDSVGLLNYAKAFETAFATADWQLRVGTGASDVWAVRMATTAGSGLGYEIGSAPSFFAPKPVAVELKSGTAEIGVYATGKPFPDSQQTLKPAGVDLNAWTQTVFQEIDAFLSATYAAPAFILDQLVVEDPEKDGYVAKILAHKRTLADAVARTVEPILESSADDAATRDAAAEKLRQALLNQLGAAFTVTAVTVFGVTDAKVRAPLGRGVVAAPRFYGQPVGTLPDGGDGQQNFSLSSGKIPLTRETGDGDSRLAFLFSSKNVTEDAYVTLDLTFAMTQLEHDIRHVPGIDAYEQSEWIAFVTGPFVSPVASSVSLPVVLRALPQPPTVTAQTGAPAAGNGNVTPADLAKWDYSFSYLYAGAAQDTVTATVKLNTPPPGTLLGQETAEQELFRTLAQFVTNAPAILADIEKYVRPIDAGTQPGGDTTDAECAVAAFESIVGAVAAAYDRWSKPATQTEGFGAGPAPVTYTFEIGLSPDEANGGRARTDIYADATVPAPTILIDPGTYTATPVPPGPGARYGWAYLRTGTTDDWLSYEQALTSFPERSVVYDDWDVFAVQNAWASVHVVRNEHLVPNQTTTDTFQFRTPEVQFAGPVVPLLGYATYDLGTLQASGTLESYLDMFFESLLSAAAGQTVAIKLAASYAYRLTSAIANFPETVLAVSLLPPAQTTPATGPPPFVAPFAGQVEHWVGTQGAVKNDSSRLSFMLEVFAGGDQQATLPLLTIRDLTLATSVVTPPAG